MRPLPRLEILTEELLGNRLGAGVYRRWVRDLGLAGTERVLEVGCGAGACARHLAEALPCGSLTCLDVDARWLAVARRRLASHDNVGFVCADIAQWQQPGAFDAVVVHFVLHDIPAENRRAALEGIIRSLAPGGRLLLREPTGHGMSGAELDALLGGAGFAPVDARQLERVPLMGDTVSGRWALA
ncbi:MAG: class I SAM-dependent methyltransferase [Actinobacteria bacterium]|nr:MAG: class I SAM-dependent methyltransferase [Actinomycetota bacterium]